MVMNMHKNVQAVLKRYKNLCTGVNRMNGDVYVLKNKVHSTVLSSLNGYGNDSNAGKLASALADTWPSDNDLDDWIAALKSGKKIVMQMSPREELLQLYNEYLAKRVPCSEESFVNGMKCGIKDAVKIIAKEHPDVADWLV
jgi:hypothetical protein